MELHGEQGQPVFYGAFRERNQQIFEGEEMAISNQVSFLENSLQMGDTLSYYLNLFSDGVLDSLHLYH